MNSVARTLLATAVLLTAGCASEGIGWRSSWDPDAPVVPLREPPAARAGEGPDAAAALAEASTPAVLRRYVVLLPDADDRLGALEVTTPDGSQTLARAGQAVDFDDPSRVIDLGADEVAAIGAAALAAEPAPPRDFVVHFEFDSTVLTAESSARWDAIAAAIAGRPVPEVTVAGHADRAGDVEHNLQLARRRAEAVRDRLVAAAIEPAWIDVVWFGEFRSAVPTPDGVAEPLNRRVELRVR